MAVDTSKLIANIDFGKLLQEIDWTHVIQEAEAVLKPMLKELIVNNLDGLIDALFQALIAAVQQRAVAGAPAPAQG